MKILNRVNPHVKAFRSVKDRFNTDAEESFHIRIIVARNSDPRIYNLPTAYEVAALIPGGFHEDMDKRDIVLQENTTGNLKRIRELHVSYLAWQYPLLFTREEDGYRLGIKKTRTNGGGDAKREHKDVGMRQWFAYRLQERKAEKHARFILFLAFDATVHS